MTDARKLWAAGSIAPAAVSVDAIVARAEAFRRRARRQHAGEYVAGTVVIVTFIAMAAVPSALSLPMLSRVGAALIACAGVFVLTYLALRGAAREVRRDASTLACYRAELERRRRLLATVTRWYLAPFWPGLALFLGGIAVAQRGIPGATRASLLSLLVVAILQAAIVVLNRRAAAKLSRELEGLPVADAESIELDRADSTNSW